MSFENDLAQMHADCDEAFAPAAMFRPASGGAYPCRAELFRPEPEFGLDHARTAVPDMLLRVVKSALPKRPAKGDLVEMAAGAFRVIETPTVEDDDGLRWTVKVERA